MDRPIPDVQFIFADSALGYDCAACEARCCRDWGFSPDEAELGPLLESYPALALCCRAGAVRSTVWNFQPGCFFLDRSSCVLHREHGFAAKPFTCRWFPHNQFYLVGQSLIVDLHHACPIRLAPAPEVLSHAAILERLHADLPGVLARTRRLHEGMSAEWMVAPPARLPADERAAFRAAAARFLHLQAPQARAGVDDLLTALGTSLRAQLLAALPGLPRPELGTAFPRILVGLELLLGWLTAIGSTPPTSVTARQVLQQSAGLLWLLAHLDSPPRLELEALPVDEPVKLPRAQTEAVRRLLSFIHTAPRLTLAELVEELGVAGTRARVELLAALPDEVLSRIRFER